MPDTTLAHFSDPHLAFEPRLTPLQRLSKRQLSVWSWRSRRHLQQMQILDALLGEVRASGAHHIVVSGDITNFALPAEFSAAARWLRTLGAADDVSVVPGNHDALVGVPEGQGLGLWADWTRADDGAAGWPFVRRRGSIALVGLNSACRTPPLLASGELGDAQLQRLETQLQRLAREGLFRIVVLHHPVAEGAVSRRKALRDRTALCALLRRTGAELVLHGHARHAVFAGLAGPAGAIPCLGLPSSSALPSARDQGARWQLLHVRPQAQSWRLQVDVRMWQVQRQSFVCAGRYVLQIARPQAGADGYNAQPVPPSPVPPRVHA